MKEVGFEAGRAVRQTATGIRRIARIMRVVDTAALAVCLLLWCAGWRSIGWTAWFAACAAIDWVVCWRTNPDRRRQPPATRSATR